MGLRCLPDGPRGDAGLGSGNRVVAAGTGEECARVICGARSRDPEDLEREWPLAKGERGRGRNANVEVWMLENADNISVPSGAVTRRRVGGLFLGEEDVGLLGRTSPGGGGGSGFSAMAMSSSARGAILLRVLCGFEGERHKHLICSKDDCYLWKSPGGVDMSHNHKDSTVRIARSGCMWLDKGISDSGGGFSGTAGREVEQMIIVEIR